MSTKIKYYNYTHVHFLPCSNIKYGHLRPSKFNTCEGKINIYTIRYNTVIRRHSYSWVNVQTFWKSDENLYNKNSHYHSRFRPAWNCHFHNNGAKMSNCDAVQFSERIVCIGSSFGSNPLTPAKYQFFPLHI